MFLRAVFTDRGLRLLPAAVSQSRRNFNYVFYSFLLVSQLPWRASFDGRLSTCLVYDVTETYVVVVLMCACLSQSGSFVR